MDPIPAFVFANECIGICTEVSKAIKRIMEAVNNLREHLVAIVRRADRTRKILTIIRGIAQRLQAAGRQDVYLLLDPDGCRDTMNRLLELAGQVSEARLRNRFVAGIQWWAKCKDVAEELCVSVQEQEDELLNTVQLVHMDITLDGLQTVQQIKAEVDSQHHLVDAFEDLRLFPGRSSVPEEIRGILDCPVWLGHTMKEGLNVKYVNARDRLADAAYFGDWQMVKECILRGKNEWEENWTNAFRLREFVLAFCVSDWVMLTTAKPRQHLHRFQSFWTPLHQAVFSDAPVEAVRWLVDRGASRTLRTRTSNYAYPDMTASELARHFGYAHLYDILSPVIRYAIPQRILLLVQEQLHTLIRPKLGPETLQEQYVWLPQLELLTETDGNLMPFPLKAHKFQNAGFVFRLDGRDLLVIAQNISSSDECQAFRITADAAEIVEDALLVNDVTE